MQKPQPCCRLGAGHQARLVVFICLLLVPCVSLGQQAQSGHEAKPAPLGRLLYAIAPGSKKYCPADTKPGSFLKTYGQPVSHKVCNGTKGNFTTDPIILMGGVVNADGVASLRLESPFVVGANLDHRAPGCGEACVSCWRVEQVPPQQGWVDCDGGSNADASLVVDSQQKRPPPPPHTGQLTVASASSDSGPGAAVLPVRVHYIRLNDTSTCPAVADKRWQEADVRVTDTAMVTGSAVSTIHNPRQCAPAFKICPRDNPYQVTLRGASLSCSQWEVAQAAQFVMPLHSLDTSILGKMVVGDVAQVLRLTRKTTDVIKSERPPLVGDAVHADNTPQTSHPMRTRWPHRGDDPVLCPDR